MISMLAVCQLEAHLPIVLTRPSSLVVAAASDTINSQQRDLLINAAHGASTAANALGMISIDMNLYAAISAFLTGVAVLLIAFKD
ncbi:hypothetical protein KGA65_14685 [Ideonella sp. B7]|uniref:hypothetical protein n=1 Tax=Ideonella benzenivorans TaxID=2831643 RepID=UPI001CED9976|nr:hypothetical protein [Ideonella benzenivorans]MCA6217779.1 hypothetical protein [Ideonella benzenivorans]